MVLAGCYSPKVAPGSPCATSDDCPSALKCVANVCGGTEPADDADVDTPSDPPPDASPHDSPVTSMLVFGDDADELRDTEIWAANATTNYGTGEHVSIDADESGLFWFDLTAIPSTKTVVSAKLTVTVSDEASESGGTATIHRLREAWVETEATWLLRANAQGWSVNGARSPSSDTASLASFTPAAKETSYEIVLPVALVQDWIADPATNFGLLIQQGTATEHVHLHGRESASWSSLQVEVY
jgi:hypothetical protein